MAIELSLDDWTDDAVDRLDNSGGSKYENGENLDAGPGKYVLKVLNVRRGKSKKKQTYGREFIAYTCEIVEAKPGAHYPVGTLVDHVILDSFQGATRLMAELVASILDTRPAFRVPADHPAHANKIIPIITPDMIDDSAEEDYRAADPPYLIAADVYAVEKDGRTHHNVKHRPPSGEWPAPEAILADPEFDLDAEVRRWYGKR